jgi:DegV family protein with EDD domain
MMYESAVEAMQMITEEMPDLPVRVVDSRTAGGAQGFVALEAARAAKTGADMERVNEVAVHMTTMVSMFAVLDTLYYLTRSGRIPKIAAWAGSMIKLNPILVFSHDGIGLYERARTKPKAVQRLIEIMKQRTKERPVHAMVMHANVPEEAEALRKKIEVEFECAELYVSDFAPTMGVQAGPGVLGIAFYAEDDVNVE